jgi:electron transfer flavoprotein alpha/beta subunit
MGAHRAILIQDPTLKQADAFVVTNVLRGVAQHLGDIDLVLLGAEVLDADLAQVGPRLATALDWPFIADAHAIAPSRAPRERYRGKIASGKIAEHPNGGNHRGPGVAVIVKQPDGFHQLTADLPAVISVAVHSNKPRYPHGRAIVDIYRAPEAVEILAAADLRLTAADLTPLVTRRGESFPPERELGKRLEGGLDEVANQLANVIRMK